MLRKDHTTDESICAEGSAHVNNVRFTVPRDPISIIIAIGFALSVAVNLWCAWTMRDIGTRKWLHDYDLNQFQMHEFAQLKGEVDVDHELIRAFGPQQCVRASKDER